LQPEPAFILSASRPELAGLFVYGTLVLAAIGVLLFLTAWLGEKRRNPEKGRPYECGVIPTGTARFRYPVPFYLVAVFFLIFDVEAACILAWAVAFRDLGWGGFLQISFFIAVLLFGLFYLWKKGELDWGTRPSKNLGREIPS